MKASLFPFALCVSFLLCQCTNNSSEREFLEEVTNSKHLEGKDSMKFIFSDEDFLQTKEPMSDDAIAPFDYKTGEVGNKPYNIQVYLCALERVKRHMSVHGNQLSTKVQTGSELNMSEDLFNYISKLIDSWNSLIMKGDFEIVKLGENHYDIEPSVKALKATSTRSTPINLLGVSTHKERWLAVNALTGSNCVGKYLGEYFEFNFFNELSGQFIESQKLHRYYVCNGCGAFGNSDNNCTYNYICTKKCNS